MFKKYSWMHLDSLQLFQTMITMDITNYHINSNEIPSELWHENLISSHVKISPLLCLHNKSSLSHQKTIKVKWFGSSLVSI